MKNYINEFDDDFTALYFSPTYTLGDDQDRDHNFAVVIRLLDMVAYTGEEEGRKTDVQVMIVPTVVTDSTWEQITSGYGDGAPDRTPEAVVEMCLDYGAHAHVTRFAAGWSLPSVDHPSLTDVLKTDDYETIAEWIRTNGEQVANVTARMIGFGMDQQQNMMGETGWDWFLPHVVENYTSETSFLHRG